jgi:hypothetical protein
MRKALEQALVVSRGDGLYRKTLALLLQEELEMLEVATPVMVTLLRVVEILKQHLFHFLVEVQQVAELLGQIQVQLIIGVCLVVQQLQMQPT